MAKNENIVSYTADELAAMQALGEDRTDWAALDAKTDPEIASDTASDPAWADIPSDWHEQAAIRSGPLIRSPENKQQITMRLDGDVLAYFQQSGRGYQTRINAVLRSYVEQMQHR